jgi:hypothetical protein
LELTVSIKAFCVREKLLIQASDLLAVLLPTGPLNQIMEDFKYGNDLLLPGLVFQDPYFMVGIGDIVVYSVLIGRAALSGLVPAMATTLGISTVRYNTYTL